MAREPFHRRVWFTLRFVFVYIFVILFKDLPRVLFKRPKKIENQVVVITGGAMGIGREVAKLLAIQHQAKVCILDVNEKEGLRTVSDIAASKGQAWFFHCDISDHQSLQRVATQIYEDPKLGMVNIVVANAAILKFGELLELTVEDYKKNSDVNILGHIYTVKTFLPQMVAARKGQIVTIGSICSHYGEHYGTAYCSAKFAIRGFTEALQMELLEKGLNDISLTSVYPYFVKTNFIQNIEEPFSTFFDVVPLERCSQEIVESILKERMTHFITGGVGLLCVYLKCLTTKGILSFGRKTFNFTYKPKSLDPERAV